MCGANIGLWGEILMCVGGFVIQISVNGDFLYRMPVVSLKNVTSLI